jgi:hypothetical protein
MFKFKRNMLPEKFNNFFQTNNEFHSYNTRNAGNLRIPRINSNLAENVITKSGAKLWNNIITIIDCNTSISIFKRKLIDHLISDYNALS